MTVRRRWRQPFSGPAIASRSGPVWSSFPPDPDSPQFSESVTMRSYRKDSFVQTTVHCSFQGLGLSEALLHDLNKVGFHEPTPIQAQAIPPGLAGRDVLGCAQTGTGKTAAFVIPMIERLAGTTDSHPRGLILAPTRELAIQIQDTIAKLGRSRRVYATTLVGGADMNAQIRGLRQRPDILVATPGRLLDHMWNGTVNLIKMQILVLDEADRMLDMGFAPQINQILEALPEERRGALEGFRRGTFRVLVATDIAARGIDVANIGHVVNYDLPNTPEDYIHRIGRTARVKASGRATSFVTSDDHIQLRAIEKLLGQPIPRALDRPPPAPRR